jgi:hypothetical protein
MVGSEDAVIWGFLGFLTSFGLDTSSLAVGFRFGMGFGCGDGDDAVVSILMGEVEFEMTRVSLQYDIERGP